LYKELAKKKQEEAKQLKRRGRIGSKKGKS
jgi:hypothetical protein